MVADHPIFQGPLPVTLEWEEADTPDNYRPYPEGKDLPPRMRVWRVQAELKQKNYGLVSDPYGFEDSPDCEYIASGINSKGPRSMALGRQGHWFLWGFCASPSEMTESGRRVLVNAIAYMKAFDGQAPLVTSPTRARGWALVYASFADRDPEAATWATRHLPASVLAEATESEQSRLDLMRQCGPYLRYEQDRYVVDEDAMALGIPNTSVDLLERACELLEDPDTRSQGLALLERYGPEGLDLEPESWRAWLAENRDRLYFTDRGGYRFRLR